MKLKKTLLSTIFGLSLLAPLFDAYAMDPDEDALQHMSPNDLQGWVRQAMREPDIDELDISQCTFIQSPSRLLPYLPYGAFVSNIRAKKIQTALALLKLWPDGCYSYIGPIAVEETSHALVHDGILCDRLGLEDKSITDEYLQELIDKKDLVAENKLDRSRCVGFAVSAKLQDEASVDPYANLQDEASVDPYEKYEKLEKKVSVDPIHIAPSLLPKKPQRLQPGTTPNSPTVQKPLDFWNLPEIKILSFSEVRNRVFPSSFCSRHFFSDIESNCTRPQILLFYGPEKKLLENIDDQCEFVEIDKVKKLKIIRNASRPSNTTPVAATAPADEMAQAEKFEAAQAAARERKEAIERAEKIAAAAQDHYNMDDLDNSLPDNATDVTD